MRAATKKKKKSVTNLKKKNKAYDCINTQSLHVGIKKGFTQGQLIKMCSLASFCTALFNAISRNARDAPADPELNCQYFPKQQVLTTLFWQKIKNNTTKAENSYFARQRDYFFSPKYNIICRITCHRFAH